MEGDIIETLSFLHVVAFNSCLFSHFTGYWWIRNKIELKNILFNKSFFTVSNHTFKLSPIVNYSLL